MMSASKVSLLLSSNKRFSAQNAVAKSFWTTSVVGEPPMPSTSSQTPERPKKPSTPFMMFSIQKRKNEPMQGTVADVAKELGRQWREMNEGAKRPYFEQFETEKKKYQETMKKFMAKLEKDGNLEIYEASELMTKSEANIRKLKMKIRKLEEEMNKPKGAPNSAFALFVSDENKGTAGRVTEKIRDVAEKWKAMPSAQKMVYEDRLKAMRLERDKMTAAWEKKNMSSEKMTELEKAMASLNVAKSKKRNAASILKQNNA